MLLNQAKGYIGFLIKEAAQRWNLKAHEMMHRRRQWPLIRHSNLQAYRGIIPVAHEAAFVAPNAVVAGNTILGTNCSVWYSAVMRGWASYDAIVVGSNTVVGERVSLLGPCKVGANVLIDVGSTLECAKIGDDVHIGAMCCVPLFCEIDSGARLLPGTVLEPHQKIGKNEIWAGAGPAKCIGIREPDAVDTHRAAISEHLSLAKTHRMAIQAHYDETAVLDEKWVKTVCEQVTEQMNRTKRLEQWPGQEFMPADSLRFLEPRVPTRIPTMQRYMTIHNNRISPWMLKSPDPVGNT